MEKLDNYENVVNKHFSVPVSILITIIASAVISISTAMFLTPLQLYASGVTGIAQIVLRVFGIILKGDVTSFEKYLNILNFLFLLPFNFLAFFKLSKKYALYTFISSIVQTIFLSFSSFWASLNVFRNASGEYDILACVIVASILDGIANGLMMRRGATSGGIITFSQYYNLKKGKSVGNISLFISALIMLCGATVSYLSGAGSGNAIGGALSTALYTLIFFILTNLVLDYIHTSYNKVKLEIITENGNELAKELIKYSPHGITMINGNGAYTGREKQILNVVVQKYESSNFIAIIKKLDPQAFITVLPVWRLTGRFIVQIIDK